MSAFIWIIIALVAVWLMLKFKEIRHRFFGTIILLLILSMFLSASYVINKQNIDLKKEGGFGEFIKYYVLWLNNVFTNTKQITGSVVGYDWSLSNNQKINYLPNTNDTKVINDTSSLNVTTNTNVSLQK